MSRHGYDDDDDFDIVDADGWKQYDSYTMRRAPQQPSIHKQLFSRITFVMHAHCIALCSNTGAHKHFVQPTGSPPDQPQ